MTMQNPDTAPAAAAPDTAPDAAPATVPDAAPSAPAAPAITYADAGVDIDEGARAVEAIRSAVRSTYTSEVIGDIGGFGGLFSAAACKDMLDPVLVSGTDGVGTKLELARRLGEHCTIGIDLVAMCVNDIVVSGARPLFFLDYLAIGKLEADFAAEVVAGIAEGCRQAGCALIGGEMAEHPGVMQAGEYDLSGFAVGLVDRPKMIGPQLVQAGDVILGLASSGLHSNGYSLVRRALTDQLSDEQLQTETLESGERLASALLAPTRIYVRQLLDALAAGLPIHAAAHITGGGISENLNRALPCGLDASVTLATWQVPDVIARVIEAAGLGLNEALKTFNMGIGLALICAPEQLGAITSHFMQGGQRVFRIGEVVRAADPAAPGQVLYKNKGE
ncbi:MAG: phosphoribosylformylglycinamidine cyclo-ligase [Coriobacteriales bacterium]|jgi:phosphoribosylformylglycinamidine cyclo-ligase|nr:phosphoribosylformylglycinamidine cyclo-ligase [Coriobacteriales bacterium]